MCEVRQLARLCVVGAFLANAAKLALDLLLDLRHLDLVFQLAFQLVNCVVSRQLAHRLRQRRQLVAARLQRPQRPQLAHLLHQRPEPVAAHVEAR